jgi:hypothetical protein
MDVEALHVLEPRLARQAILDGQNNLRDDAQIAVNKHIQRVRHHPFGRIFHRHHPVIGAVLADFGENVGDGFLRRVTQAGAEALHGRLMRERRLRPEVGDGHRFLQRQCAGHDLPVNGAQRFVLDRALVELADALQNHPLAMRHVNGLAGLDLDLADLQDVLACAR